MKLTAFKFAGYTVHNVHKIHRVLLIWRKHLKTSVAN